jgi:hydrogenase maturation protease
MNESEERSDGAVQTVVLGIGNLLLTDEGAGVHAARRIAELLRDRPDITVIDAGTLSFTLAPEIERADRLIVFDAAQLHSAPGTVCSYVNEDMDRFLGKGKHSAHEVGLVDLFQIAHLTERVPAQRALFGIQPQKLDWGDQPTPEVDAGVNRAVALAMELLDAWEREGAAPCCNAEPV